MVNLWHLTEDPDWKLDPEYRPRYAYGVAPQLEKPGLYVTDHPLYWKSYFGQGPIWAVRVEVPEEILPKPSAAHPEYLIRDLDRIRVLEIIPLSEAIEKGREEDRRGIPWWKQHYGGFGGVADWWFVYDDIGQEKVPRKGLSKLMNEWKKTHPGYKDPDEEFTAKHRR